MNDHRTADDPATADVDLSALRRPGPVPDVDLRALGRPGPAPEVDAEALSRPAIAPDPPEGRRRRVIIGVAAVALMALAGGGLWWNRQVTADPGLQFSGGLNVARDEAGTDRSGIAPRQTQFPSDVDEVVVAFVPKGRLYAAVSLSNHGGHDVRIEAVRPGRYYYWGLDRVAVVPVSHDARFGFSARYEPFRPFTLQRGKTRELRLDFRLADCDPARPATPGVTAPCEHCASATGSSASAARRTSPSATRPSHSRPWERAPTRSGSRKSVAPFSGKPRGSGGHGRSVGGPWGCPPCSLQPDTKNNDLRLSDLGPEPAICSPSVRPGVSWALVRVRRQRPGRPADWRRVSRGRRRYRRRRCRRLRRP